MKKDIFCVALCAVLFALCIPAAAQQAAKMPKIGFLSAAPASRPWRASFQREFENLGYVDGKNVNFTIALYSGAMLPKLIRHERPVFNETARLQEV